MSCYWLNKSKKTFQKLSAEKFEKGEFCTNQKCISDQGVVLLAIIQEIIGSSPRIFCLIKAVIWRVYDRPSKSQNPLPICLGCKTRCGSRCYPIASLNPESNCKRLPPGNVSRTPVREIKQDPSLRKWKMKICVVARVRVRKELILYVGVFCVRETPAALCPPARRYIPRPAEFSGIFHRWGFGVLVQRMRPSLSARVCVFGCARIPSVYWHTCVSLPPLFVRSTFPSRPHTWTGKSLLSIARLLCIRDGHFRANIDVSNYRSIAPLSALIVFVLSVPFFRHKIYYAEGSNIWLGCFGFQTSFPSTN